MQASYTSVAWSLMVSELLGTIDFNWLSEKLLCPSTLQITPVQLSFMTVKCIYMPCFLGKYNSLWDVPCNSFRFIVALFSCGCFWHTNSYFVFRCGTVVDATLFSIYSVFKNGSKMVFISILLYQMRTFQIETFPGFGLYVLLALQA